MVEYIVTLRGKAGSGAHLGVVNWIKFANKEEFDKWFDDTVKARFELVEEGITEARAQELCKMSRPPSTASREAGREDARINEARLEERFEPGWSESEETYEGLRRNRR
jgi:hypothetical protein